MRAIRIYQPGDYQVGDSLLLSEEAGLHVGVVLRRQVGDTLTLFSGNNREFLARITALHKKKVTVLLLSASEVTRESPLAIHLAQAVSKGDRMEWVVQKAVELGVASISPLITERCAIKLDAERMEKKRGQWQAIAISACEQCGRNQVPVIHSPIRLADYLAKPQAVSRFVLQPEGMKNWRDYEAPDNELALLIGPEGGLEDEEIKQINLAGFASLNLGPRILRTETAAIAGLSILQAVWGDL